MASFVDSTRTAANAIVLAGSPMKDSARSVTPPRSLHLPPPGRPRWVCPPSAELDLLYLGWGRRRFGTQPVPVTRHPGWVYFLVCAGRPVLRMAHQVVRTRPGLMVIVGPDCASGWTDEAGGTCEVLTWVWRTASRCPACAPPADGWSEQTTDAPLRRALLQGHALCRREVEGPGPLTKLALEQARLSIDLALARAQEAGRIAAAPELRMELALRWMAQNLTIADPVRPLCQYLHVSPVTLYRMFQTHLGESPAEHHRRLRMERGRHLLNEPDITVKEVAFALGYRHANDFTRAFRNYAGQPPGALFRRRSQRA